MDLAKGNASDFVAIKVVSAEARSPAGEVSSTVGLLRMFVTPVEPT
jgi:hypothetical protein